ncbi:TlpA family protein disulfide reductase [Patescibacteria group bacterium]
MRFCVIIGVVLILAVSAVFLLKSDQTQELPGNDTTEIETQISNSENKESENLGYTPTETTNPIRDLELQTIDGKTIKLSDYEGKKAVVVDFWASWCHNCQRDMPNMQILSDKYADDVAVIAINLQESESTIRKFVDKNNFDFIVVVDAKSEASRVMGVRYTNTHVLIGKEGNITKIIPGDVSESDFKSLI